MFVGDFVVSGEKVPLASGLQINRIASVLKFAFEVVDGCLYDAASSEVILEVFGLTAISSFVNSDDAVLLIDDENILQGAVDLLPDCLFSHLSVISEFMDSSA